jgi:IAA-amino acid hydrolase
MNPISPQLLAEAREQAEWIVAVRRELHRHPELGYQETRTSALIRKKLDELGIAYRHPIAETGVLATLGGGDGPCIALRADIDALPIDEAADVPFRSETPGKMHACGHDCHTAMLLGAAKLLKARERELRGTVKLIFQPAEEGGAGGKRMCDEGVLDGPKVERIFGLHVWPMLPTGKIGSRPGTFLASAGSLTITVRGKGGHAAMPQFAIDPVTTAAKIICELQTIVARELDPLESGVISVTTVHAGEAYNVIPQEVKLTGTIRSLTHEGMKFLQDRIRETCEHVAIANRCTAEVAFPGNDYPPTVNDAALWELAQSFGRKLLGDAQVCEVPPIMGGEDFAYYAERIPGVFVGLGIRNEAVGSIYSVHHPMFKVDESALPIGTALHAAFALQSLAELNERGGAAAR